MWDMSAEITITLTNERHILVGSYFYTYVSHLFILKASLIYWVLI